MNCFTQLRLDYTLSDQYNNIQPILNIITINLQYTTLRIMASESKDEIIDALRRQVAELEKRNVELERRMKEKETPTTSPIYITEGSFGKISSYPLQNFVYKTTILSDKANGKKLEHEFEM